MNLFESLILSLDFDVDWTLWVMLVLIDFRLNKFQWIASNDKIRAVRTQSTRTTDEEE